MKLLTWTGALRRETAATTERARYKGKGNATVSN